MEKRVTIIVPQEYEIDEIFFKNPYDTSQIIDLGVKSFNALKNFKYLDDDKQEIERLKTQIDSLENELNYKFEIEIMKYKNNHNQETESLKKQIEELKKLNENSFNDFTIKLQNINDIYSVEKQKIKDDVKKDYEIIKKLNENVYEEKINHLLMYKERNEINEKRINELQKKNEEIFERMSFLSKSSNKGKEAEFFLQSYINDKFKLSKLFDMTNEPHSGDYHLHLNNSKILIESKNVEKIQKVRDLDKFVRDIQTCSNQNKINAGLFICFNDIIIKDGTRNFIFEFIDNTPVIYISNAIDNLDMISTSILILENIVSSLNYYKQSSEEFEQSRKHIIDLLKIIITNIDTLNQDILLDEQDINNLLSRINKKKENMRNINLKIIELFNHDKSLSNIQEEDIDIESMFIDKVKHFFKDTKVTTKMLTEQFPNDTNLIKRIGIKKINDSIKN